jgi:hypothetical protein
MVAQTRHGRGVGLGGVTKVYNENDLGGWHAVGNAIVAF